MASGPVVGGDDGAKEKPKHKVYTRKAFKDRKKDPNSLNTAAATATVKNDDTATTTATTAAQNDNNATAMNDDNASATIAATTTVKHDDTSTSSTIATTTAKNDGKATTAAKNDDNGTATSTVTATAKKDTPIATTKNDEAATTTAIPSVSETATATPSTTTTTATPSTTTTTATPSTTTTTATPSTTTTTATPSTTTTTATPSTTTTTATIPATTTTTVVETATKNIDDSSNSINITIKMSETDEPKGNCDDISEEPLPPLGAVPENGNLVQLQVSPRLKDGSSSGPQEKSRLEGGSSAVLEDGNSNQPQKIPRLEDGSSSGQQEKISVEDGSSCQPQEKSRIKGGAPAPHQENSRLEDGIPAPQQESSLNDGVSAMQFEKSRLEKENSALVQENSRLEDGESAQLQKASRLEDENLVQPQVDSRWEDEDSDQPQTSSRLEDKDLTLDQPQGSSRLDVVILAQPQASSRVEDEDLAQDQTHVGSRMDVETLAQPLTSSRLEDANLALPQVGSNLEGGKSAQPPVCSHQQEEPSTSLNVTQNLPLMNETMEQVLEDRIKISLLSTSKQERQGLRWKLESELDVVRNLVKRIELKQGQAGVYGRLNVLVGDGINNSSGTKRSLSELASAGVPRGLARPLHQLSLSMLENSQGVSESVEKEKRTPKANQFYRNSEFLLAKDKFPPAESNKKSKLSLKMQGGGEMGQGFAMGSKFFKSCNSLLEKLMKHKHAWVFNTPVDVEGLGLHDYHSIITHPMDLGTVKSRMNKNWYKSPKEFAEDVRLTFQNAMTYNPKGQDVHVMAEQLSKIFEDRWAIIESDYNREMRYGIDYGAAPLVPSSLSRKVPTFPPPPLDTRRILDRSESLKHTPRFMTITPSSRTPAPKKPKAKDPNKRDMTFEEKQKLSTNLQSLPSEKLDAIVQIIKKRNSALSQHDDEIEVDIDSVDAETLWELDRFVTNYKKSLSKNKRKLELAQARAEAARNALQKTQVPVMVEVPRETQADERNVPPSLPVQGANLAGNGSRSSSSSSSSSDSGSSSSDSDSDSSSASGSDAGSQGT